MAAQPEDRDLPVVLPPRRPSVVVSCLLVGIAGVLWLVLGWALLFVVPSYERVFADFRMRLPSATVVTLAVARWTAKYWYILVIMALPDLVAAVVLTHLVRQRHVKRWLTAAWFVLLFGLPLLAQVWLWSSVLIPYAKLLDGLSGARRG